MQENGDVDDYAILVFENESHEDFIIPDSCVLKFPLTDCKSDARTVWDSATNDTIWEWKAAIDENGVYVIRAKLAGYVPAKGERAIGLHAVRRKLATVLHSSATFADPIDYTGMGPIFSQRVTVQATVIFPPSDSRRALSADNAIRCTSRTATWDFAPAEYSPERIHASVRTSYLPAVPRHLDDAIVETHRLLALDGIGKSAIRLEELRQSLLLVVRQAPDALGHLLSRISDFSAMEPPARRRVLTELLSTLHEIRTRMMQDSGTLTVTDDITELAERVSCEVSDCLAKNFVRTPPPIEFWDSLRDLIRFAQLHREAEFPELEHNASERVLHGTLERFLRGQTGAVFREPEIGNGRIDLLLRHTPVELKVDDLGETPREAVERHKQQAAEYASREDVSVAILVVLDTHKHRKGSNHQPHLSEQIQVIHADSRPGISGSSLTAVVAIALSACTPKPHSLKKTTRKKSTNRAKPSASLSRRR